MVINCNSEITFFKECVDLKTIITFRPATGLLESIVFDVECNQN